MGARNSIVTIVTTLLLGGAGCSSSSDPVDAAVKDASADAAASDAVTTLDGHGADTATAADSSDSAAASSDAGPAPVTAMTGCSFAKDKNVAITVPANRDVVCALDLGSNNAKLVVMSIEKNGKPETLKDERPCKNQLRLGTKVFDSTTMVAGPLPDADLAKLILVIKDFQRICALDNGRMMGAEATQWARDATNITLVLAAIKAETTLDVEVLSSAAEGTYGYSAATYNAPERIVLDPGSNSFQLSFWLKGDTAPKAISLPFGYTRAAIKYFANVADTTIASYAVARMKYVDEVKAGINAELAKLTPPTTLGDLKAAVAAGKTSGDLYLLGQDGAVALGVGGQLKPGGTWIADQKAYDTLLGMQMPTTDPKYLGQISGLLMPATLTTFATSVSADDFTKLRTTPIREIYGDKLLTNAALVDLLITELGLTNAVLVPQELPAGYILAKLAKPGN